MSRKLTSSSGTSLQDRFDSQGICFGCGPTNAHGLKIKSYVQGDLVVASFTPSEHHQGFEGMVNGGIIGALFDCHMNWTAAWNLMQAAGAEEPPCTVTGNFHVHFLAPTPTKQELQIEAKILEMTDRKASVEATLCAGGEITAKGQGVFIAVKEGHPAFQQWKGSPES
ncbi:MAG: PaaI family thioesterase [Planctomycetota bacterium]